MSDWEVAPEPAPTESTGSDWTVAPEEHQTRSFLDKAKDVAGNAAEAVGNSFSRFGHTVARAGRGALDLISPVTREGGFHVPFSQLSDPAYRHELERGVSDTVTGGLAEKAANAVDPSFASAAPAEAAAAPNARALGQAGGTALPSPFNYVGGKVAGLVKGTGALPAAARGVVGYEASAVPQAAVQGAVNAEPGHRLEEAAKAAREAATDPASIAAAGAIPAAHAATKSFLEKRIAKAHEVEASAKKIATKDLATDITSAEGSKARVTDQKRISEVRDRLFELTKETPGLREVFGKPAEKALPEIERLKQHVAEPLDRIQDTIDEHTGGGIPVKDVVGKLRSMADEAGKSVSGLGDKQRLNILADQFEEVYGKGAPEAAPTPTAKPLAKGEASALQQQIAELESLRENAKGVAKQGIEEQIAKAKAELGGGPGLPAESSEKTKAERPASARNPSKGPKMAYDDILQKWEPDESPHGNHGLDFWDVAGQPETERNRVNVRGGELPYANTKVSTPPVDDRGPRIPTKQFRQEVTALLKKSDSVFGAIEGTARHEALQKLYTAGKQIIDEHIDSSGVPQDLRENLRKRNDQYFLLSRAEAAIQSRGFKEANKPGFHLVHTARQAMHSATGLAGGAGAIAYMAMHPHSIPYVAGGIAAGKVVPAAAKAIAWNIANGGYTRSLNRLIGIAKKLPAEQFAAAAARAGMSAEQAAKISEKAKALKSAPAEASP